MADVKALDKITGFIMGNIKTTPWNRYIPINNFRKEIKLYICTTLKVMKNIIITGTSRGIGFELVQQLASQGHNILALSRHTASIGQSIDLIQGQVLIDFGYSFHFGLKILTLIYFFLCQYPSRYLYDYL